MQYEVEVETRPERIERKLKDVPAETAATVFQSPEFLGAWYSTVGRAVGDPVLVVVRSTETRSLAAMFPLVRHEAGRARVIAFADAGVSDYNAPVLGPASPSNTLDAGDLWSSLRAALPEADLVRFTKMPFQVDGRANPLSLLSPVLSSPVCGNLVTIDDWDRYQKSLERRFRKELRRCWRVFQSGPGRGFCRICEAGEAARVIEILERQQFVRFRRAGANYVLDRPEFVAFYRRLVAIGIESGRVVLTVLRSNDDVVSALIGLTHGRTFVMLRLSAELDEWSHCSPGRLVITKTMQMLQSEGYRHFDFSLGNQAYKRRLGVKAEPLFAFSAALSIRGLPFVAYDRAKHVLRGYPVIDALARRAFRRKVSAGDSKSSGQT